MERNKPPRCERAFACAALLLAALTLAACAGKAEPASGFAHDYGVFLSYEGDLSALSAYQTVVVDAQYFSAADIAAFRAAGHTVLSYLNVGALEDFRDYYDEYSTLALGAYEHWDEEVWIDVSSPDWQAFLLDTLAPELREKGVDGFFVDNCDVYYKYPGEDILTGLTAILKGLRADGAHVVLNGGDAYLDAFCASGGDAKEIADGVNQECVFTAVDWDDGSFREADAETRAYFTDYLDRCAARGLDVYVLEYAADARLAEQAEACCARRRWRCYAADSLELGAPREN